MRQSYLLYHMYVHIKLYFSLHKLSLLLYTYIQSLSNVISLFDYCNTTPLSCSYNTPVISCCYIHTNIPPFPYIIIFKPITYNNNCYDTTIVAQYKLFGSYNYYIVNISSYCFFFLEIIIFFFTGLLLLFWWRSITEPTFLFLIRPIHKYIMSALAQLN